MAVRTVPARQPLPQGCFNIMFVLLVLSVTSIWQARRLVLPTRLVDGVLLFEDGSHNETTTTTIFEEDIDGQSRNNTSRQDEDKMIPASPLPVPQEPSSRRISFQVTPGRTPSTHTKYICKEHERHTSPMIDESFSIRTTITSDLKIAVVGDSLGYQFAHSLESSWTNETHTQHSSLHWTYRRIHEGLFVVQPNRGGGSLTFWRMTGMWRAIYENKPLPYQGKGWLADHAQWVRNSTASPTNATDVMIFRIPFGWISPNVVTPETLLETFNMAKRHLGVSHIIFVAMFFNNNVVNHRVWQEVKAGNQRLVEFSKEHPSTVAVLRMDRLINELLQWNTNALSLQDHSGKRSDNNNTSDSEWVHHVINDRLPGKHPSSIPHVCGMPPINDTTTNTVNCQRNMVSLDGMHLCVETVGGRINAGIACLIGCAYNPNHQASDVSWKRDCEDQCNARYMTMKAALDDKASSRT